MSTIGPALLGGSLWMGRWRREQQRAWRKQIFEAQRWKQVLGLELTCVKFVILAFTWPRWQTLQFEEHEGSARRMSRRCF